MATYRCVLIGQNGQAKAVEEFHAVTKVGALMRARRMLRARSPECTAFELWLGHEKFHRESRARKPEPTA